MKRSAAFVSSALNELNVRAGLSRKGYVCLRKKRGWNEFDVKKATW